MDIDRLKSSVIGRLVPISGTDPRTAEPWRYWAYLADPLPEVPELSARAIRAASEAGMAVARLDERVAQLPQPRLLVRPSIRREAASTSALEGTYASFEDVIEADFLEEGQMSFEQREINNYVKATEYALQVINDRRISRTLLGELQHTIVRGTAGETADAGDLRPHQVAIGARGKPIEMARFVPSPPGDHLEAGVRAWEDWIECDNDVLIIAKIAIAHYQFETLHPFGDGNGRLGRLIAILQLIKAGELRFPVLNIAPWFENRREEYQDGLLETTMSGDFSPWVEFFSHAVEVQAQDALTRIQHLLSIRDSMVGRLRAKKLRGSAIELAELLIGYPVIDVPTVKLLLNKSFEACNNAVAKLVDEGILEEVTGNRQNRLFVCREVWTAVRWQ